MVDVHLPLQLPMTFTNQVLHVKRTGKGRIMLYSNKSHSKIEQKMCMDIPLLHVQKESPTESSVAAIFRQKHLNSGDSCKKIH